MSILDAREISLLTSPNSPRPGWGDYCGLFLIALATLMLEILLTRIFSVTLWYHLAFVAVSIAMFGMTAGAVIVYLAARWFTPPRAWLNLSLSSALFALTAFIAVGAHLRSAIDPNSLSSPLWDLSRAYGVIAVPFVFSGIAVAIALTRFPDRVGRLYAADLGGAALGCMLLMPLLDRVGGPWSVVFVSCIGGLASVAFAVGSHAVTMPRRRVAVAAAGLAVIAVIAATALLDPRALEIRYAKGTRWQPPIYEKWNSHSRVAITLDGEEEPFGWGLSSRFRVGAPVRQLHLNIDASAETVLTGFVGDLEMVDHLRYDVVNSGLHLLNGGSVYVIGAGGGRDVLSALVFGATRIVAVELNRSILDALNGVFGNITGHLDRDPRVQFVHDEARSYLARSDERFDFIQISLIDTWAATAAGAFVLSENTLYTRDAWRTFLSRLTDRGILSVSRWYGRPDPHEIYKTIVLATTALRDAGIRDTRRHIVVIARLFKEPGMETAAGVGTLLVKRTPFTDADLARLAGVAEEMDFDMVLTPTSEATPAFAHAAEASTVDQFIDSSTLDMAAPTDDRPFFFKMEPRLLNGLLTFVVTLAVALIALPVLLKADLKAITREGSLSLAFVAFGLGFMLIEIAQMMRLTLLLGHPTFSLSVVLFGMLLSSGAGSATTTNLRAETMSHATMRRMTALVAILVLLGLVTPWVVDVMRTASTPLRVAAALALLAPAGFFMGMMFPMAIALTAVRAPQLGPWLWGINGAASVCASVLTVAIASSWGVSVAWWVGTLCYIAAAALIVRSARWAAATESPLPR